MSKRLSEPVSENERKSKKNEKVEKKLTSKSRDTVLRKKNASEDESWKYTLPAYDYRTKRGKQMRKPIVDDTLIGGFARMGGLSEEEARHQQKQLMEQEEARKKAEAKERQKAYNPFDGFDDAFQDDETLLI